MSFCKISTSFTRFRIVDDIPKDLWPEILNKLRQFAMEDIDDLALERSFGWTNFDDMLDTKWRLTPPEKGEYITFSLRQDTRRIPPAVLKKHTRLALQAEEQRMAGLGQKFVSRDRRKEITEQVKLRLLGRFLPIPAEFQVVWSTANGQIYFGSTHGKVIDLFVEHFLKTFDLHLEQLQPYALAELLLGEKAESRLEYLEPTKFV